ncbi:MAG: methyl-accepting chemotaxis protein [Fibromonadales bacterium]|nr:methyl-accepting chemotaxis protein [Fibromonadales bacterium]
MLEKLFKKMNLQLKIVGLASIAVTLSIVVLEVMSGQAMKNLSLATAITMGERALNGYMEFLQSRVTSTYGQLRLVNGQLVDENGISITNNFNVVDEVHKTVGTTATIFVKDGNNFRRVTTTLQDGSGNREVGTLLASNNLALSYMLRGEEFRDRTFVLGVEHLAMYRPIFSANNTVIGYLSVATEMEAIQHFISHGITDGISHSLIVSGIVLALTIAFLILTCRIILVKPITRAVNMLREISEGDGDLTKELHVVSHDEIGKMAHYFNMTMEKIKKMIIGISLEASSLSNLSTELVRHMDDTAAAMNEITANTDSIKGRVINQSASVSETNATMEQVTVNIDKLNGYVEMQAAAVSQSSAAIEQMIANIQSVTSTLAKNAENVKELEEASDVGRTGLGEVAADIQEISRESESLLEINSVMENIASQTNLLSMNAAIEAAHAGESGKGFAVVADEIRKLAESSSAQSKTIGAVLKKIKGSIDKIMKSTDNVLNKFEAIDGGVKTVAEQENSILNAMEEQGQGSKQVLSAIAQVSEITDQVKDGSRQMLEGSKEVISESKNLSKATEEITGGMSEMVIGANRVNTAIMRVNDLSAENRKNIESLMAEVSRFKVE